MRSKLTSHNTRLRIALQPFVFCSLTHSPGFSSQLNRWLICPGLAAGRYFIYSRAVKIKIWLISCSGRQLIKPNIKSVNLYRHADASVCACVIKHLCVCLCEDGFHICVGSVVVWAWQNSWYVSACGALKGKRREIILKRQQEAT